MATHPRTAMKGRKKPGTASRKSGTSGAGKARSPQRQAARKTGTRKKT
jgi:hypothetical protein